MTDTVHTTEHSFSGNLTFPAPVCLQQILLELKDSEQRVNVLQELSVQLLVQAQGSECLEAQERVHVIGNRLRLLLKAVASDLQMLKKELQVTRDAQVSLFRTFTCSGDLLFQ